MPDLLLQSFERKTDERTLSNGQVKASVTTKRATDGKRSLELRFPAGGGSVELPLPKRKWSGRGALKFDVYASGPAKRVHVVVKDTEGTSFREWYHEEFGLRKGWSGVQMPMAELARQVNLEKVKSLELRVVGGSVTLGLDRVRLGDLEDGYDTRLAPKEYLPKQDIEFSTEVETPHVKWGNPLQGGPIRGLFIPSIRYGRDMVELQQRLDLKATTVSIDRAWDVTCWGVGDYYGHVRGDRNDYRLVDRYVERELESKKRFDVMVIPCLNGWNRFPKAMRDAIRRRVRQGAGLVLIHPFTGDIYPDSKDLWDISPLVGVANDTVNEGGYPELNRDAITTGTWQTKGNHYITDGVPMESMPTQHLPFYKYDSVNGSALIESDGHPILAVKRYGKGRVAAFGYVEAGFTPMDVPPSRTNTWDDFYPDTPRSARPKPSQVTWPYWEYYYSLLSRAIVWSSGREPSTRIVGMDADGRSVQLNVKAPRKTQVTVDLSVTDKFGQKRASLSRRRTLAAGDNRLSLDLPDTEWDGGISLVDAVMRSGDARLDWSTDVFWTEQKVTVSDVKVDKEVYDVGSKLSGVVITKGKPSKGMHLRLSVMDDRNREVLRDEVPLRKQKTPFSLRLTAFLGRYGRIDVSVQDEKRTVDRYLSEEFVVVPVKRNQPVYKALPSFGSGHKRYLRDAVDRQVRQNGTDFGAWGSRHNNDCGVFGVGIYHYHRAPYLEQKKKWQATKNKRYLWRRPCLSDPEHIRKIKAAIRREVKQRLAFRFDDYFLADESSITCYTDSFDLCFSPHTLKAFRKWLRKEYGSLKALNETWGTSHATWDRVQPLTTEEAKAQGRMAPWMDHRTFMNWIFAETFRMFRETIRSVDPEGRTSLSGTQVSVAYNGCDWWQLAPYIDRMICYQGGDQWELHRSFNPSAAVGFWTGYGSSGLAVQNAIWKALFHNISAPNIFWMYCYMNADLTYSKSGRDMGTVFKELRQGGIGRLVTESTRQHDGIAIHYSYPSIFATTFDDDFRRYSANRTAWTHLVEDLGIQDDFVAYGEIETGRLRKGDYRVLILPYTKALSDKERREIRSFVARGGCVIADAMAGVMDNHGSVQTPGMLDRVFGIAKRSEKREPKPAGRARWTGLTIQAPASLKGVQLAEPELKASGEAQVMAGGSPGVILNDYREGKACYLNFLVDDYRDARDGDGEAGQPLRDIVGGVLAHAGVTPEIRVVDVSGVPVRHLEAVTYALGERRFLCLRKENVAAKTLIGHDGVATYVDDTLGQVVAESIRIMLPKAAYAVNLRTGESYGKVRTIRETLRVGDSMVIALSGERPAAVKVTGAGSVRAGTPYRYSVTVDADAVGERVIRVNVYDPDGEYDDLYSMDVRLSGRKHQGEIPIAHNDKPGVWRLEVVDVGGQQRAVKEFEIK